MTVSAIHVDGIGKRYRLGEHHSFGSLRESLMNRLSSFGRQRPASERASIWALRDVSFEVAQGEAVGIIGRNGAGKSTLLKVLSRITEPTEGRAVIRGRVGSLLEVGTGFHPELTGRENIFLNGAILGMRRAEIAAKLDEIVAFAEVERFTDTPVKRYSSGMYLRLAFAVAAHLEPEILLVDEVLAVGDSAFQKKCLGKMDEVAKQGRTVLFVSHNMSAISSLCRRALWIDQGQVRLDGEATSVVTEYLSQGHSPETQTSTIPAHHHAHKPLGLVFDAVQVVDSSGNPTSGLFFNTPLIVRLEFSADRPFAGVRLIVAVHRLDGTLVAALHHTDDPRQQMLAINPGRYVVQVSSQICLMPGSYSISLAAKPDPGFFGSGELSLDYVEGARVFHVDKINEGGSAPPPSGAIVYGESQWEIRPTEA